jgi:hypothetical protein
MLLAFARDRRSRHIPEVSHAPSYWRSPRVIVPLAALIGLTVRLAPCLLHPDFRFFSDAAYHQRLVEETVAAGRVPAIDRLSNAPEGRRTASELPVGLYAVSALAHRGLSALGLRDLRWNLAFLVALWGGLIAIPVWFGARAAFGNPTAASLAALGSVLLPAHLQRSYGFWLRYDALGTLLVATHVALALATLSSARPWRRRGLASASAAFLVAALWVWRVSFVVLAIELAFVVLRLATRGAEPALRDLWVAIAAIGSATLPAVEYLRERGFLLSPAWLCVVGLAAACCLPPLRAGGRRAFRLAAIVVVAGLATWLGWTRVPPAYAGLGALLPAKLGLARGHDPVAVLMLEVEELGGIPPWSLAFGTQELFVLGAWLLASPILFWWLAGRPPLARWSGIDPAPALLALMSAGLAACTLLFERTSVLLAPFAAMALGGLGARLVGAPAARAEPAPASRPPVQAPRPPAKRRRRGSPRPIRGWLAAGLVASSLATQVAGIAQALSSGPSLPPDEDAALTFLRDHTPRDAVILAFWDGGYDIQTHAGRATAIDGLLESDENRRRIFAFDAALMAATPDSLERLCELHHARWLLVPPLPYLYTVAAVAGDPIAARIARGDPLRVGVDTERVLYHLMVADVQYPGFRRAYQAGDYRVYEYARGSPR